MRVGPPQRVAAALLSLAACACTNTVVPPPAPAQPAAAFLLDHGRHSSLVLERPDGITRYSYGHWAYYARNRTGALRASGTLFGANAAGLGRRHLPGPAEMTNVHRRIRVPIEHAWRIEVPAAAVDRLAGRLDRLFVEQAASRIDNPLYDLEFVRHPDPYRTSHNSNHVTGAWLRELGCRVDTGTPFSVWHVTAPGSSR